MQVSGLNRSRSHSVAMARTHWVQLGRRLRSMVQLQQELQLGNMSEVYGSMAVSAYTEKKVGAALERQCAL